MLALNTPTGTTPTGTTPTGTTPTGNEKNCLHEVVNTVFFISINKCVMGNLILVGRRV